MQDETSKKTNKATPKKNIEISPSIAKSEAATSIDKIKKSAAPKKAVAKKAAVKKTATKKATVKKDNLLTIYFQLTYGTHFGQNIFLSGNIPQLGNGHDENALKLDYIDHLHWGGEIKLSKSDIPEEGLQYFYIVINEDGSLEKSAPYYLYKNEVEKDIHVFDAWNYSGYIQNAFTTKVFDVLTKKTKTNSKKSSSKTTHLFKISAPDLLENHVIFLSGNHSDLGNWHADNIILLEPQEHSNIWSASITINADGGFIEYKYGIYDTASNSLVSFEEGENRVLDISKSKLSLSIVNDGFIRYN